MFLWSVLKKKKKKCPTFPAGGASSSSAFILKTGSTPRSLTASPSRSGSADGNWVTTSRTTWFNNWKTSSGEEHTEVDLIQSVSSERFRESCWTRTQVRLRSLVPNGTKKKQKKTKKKTQIVTSSVKVSTFHRNHISSVCSVWSVRGSPGSVSLILDLLSSLT